MASFYQSKCIYLFINKYLLLIKKITSIYGIKEPLLHYRQKEENMDLALPNVKKCLFYFAAATGDKSFRIL